MHKFSKYTLLASSIATMAVIPAATISCNMSVGFKPAVFNYEDYIDPGRENIISDKFNYKTFGDLPELEQALKQGRAAAGIGSDYYNAKLAKQGVIKKIDFYKALHIDPSIKDIEAKLKTLYTPVVWKQMKMFDGYLGDIDNDGTPNHLWEYMVPYFTQYKVLAFNIKRGNWNPAELKILSPTSGTDKEKQLGVETLFTNHTYKGLLETLKAHGYNNFVNNDYSRDNLMIGSEYTGEFTGKLTQENYKGFTNNYVKTIEEGLGINFNSSNVVMESSGTASLDHLVNTDQNWGASFLYNGDVQYAHYGGSEENESEGENIRFVTPVNPVYLVDGFVISDVIKKDSGIENDVYDSFYNSVFKGIDANSVTDDTPAYINYDYVGYTTPFKSIYDYVDDSSAGGYFEDDWVGKGLLPVKDSLTDRNIIWPIEDKLQNNYSIYYEQATKS